jgi:hypothetical protein
MEAKLGRVQTPENDTKPIVIKCSRCNYQWGYKGRNPYIVSCPYCKDTLTIRKHRINPVTDLKAAQHLKKESLQTEEVEDRASAFQSAIGEKNRSGECFIP